MYQQIICVRDVFTSEQFRKSNRYISYFYNDILLFCFTGHSCWVVGSSLQVRWNPISCCWFYYHHYHHHSHFLIHDYHHCWTLSNCAILSKIVLLRKYDRFGLKPMSDMQLFLSLVTYKPLWIYNGYMEDWVDIPFRDWSPPRGVVTDSLSIRQGHDLG